MKKLLAALLAMVMTMSLLTACGNAETATDETAVTEDVAEATEDTAEAADETEADAAEADTTEEAAVSEAIADGVLTVGTNAEFLLLSM